MSIPAWQTSKLRRYRPIVAIMILVTLGGIEMLRYRLRHPSPDFFYREGMRILKNDGQDKDLNLARKYFSAVVQAKDPRGNFGIACVLWQRHPSMAFYSDGPGPQRITLAREQLVYASHEGVIGAQAALLSYDVLAASGTTTMRDLSREMSYLIAEAKDASSTDDPALPPYSLSQSNMESYFTSLLNSGLCAPPLSEEMVHMLIQRAFETSKEDEDEPIPQVGP